MSIVSSAPFDPPAVTVRAVWLSCQPIPDGDAEPERLTVPAKPLSLRTVIVEVNEMLGVTVFDPGVENIVNEGTCIVTVFV